MELRRMNLWIFKYLRLKVVTALGAIMILGGLTVISRKYSLHMYTLDSLGIRKWYVPSDMMCKDKCLTFRASYIIENQQFCEGDVFLLVAVNSAFSNMARRMAVRKTWGSQQDMERHGARIKIVFFVGSSGHAGLESETHSDIVQVNITDEYRLLVNKSVAILHWVSTYCPQAQFLLKADDDTFNYLPNYVSYLQPLTGTAFVGGRCFTVAPHTSKWSRYYDPVFTGARYPVFCLGPAYVISQYALTGILQASQRTVMTPMEDTYIAGLCRVVANIPYVQIPGMDFDPDKATTCAFASDLKSVQQIDSGMMFQLWKRSCETRLDEKCSSLVVICLIFVIPPTLVTSILCAAVKFEGVKKIIQFYMMKSSYTLVLHI